MDILFLGGVFDDEEIIEKSKGVIQYAANALQWNIIKGLDICNGYPINILNSVFIGSYPRNYKDMIINSYKWSHAKGANNKNVGFINVAGIKHFTRAYGVTQEIKEWAQNGYDDKYIFIYSVHSPFLYAVMKAKKINPRIKTCLIVPDLPQYMKLTSSPSKLYLILKSLDSKLIFSLLKYIDSYVLLTEHMADYFKITKDRYIVMEGMVNLDDLSTVEDLNEVKDGIRKILYTGTLNWKYGIRTLLEAFEKIKNKNYRLQICGSGEAESEIIRLCKKDVRIEYFGSVKRNKALQLQREATVLINPRNLEGEYTRYSFPSKNMEYLLSGRPTIAYKLPGIPEEYKNYMYFIEESTSDSMAKKIIEVCETDYKVLLKFGKNARDFVIREKNNIKQAERMIKMLHKER